MGKAHGPSRGPPSDPSQRRSRPFLADWNGHGRRSAREIERCGRRRGASATFGLHARPHCPGQGTSLGVTATGAYALSRGASVASVRTAAVTAFSTAWLSGYGFLYFGHQVRRPNTKSHTEIDEYLNRRTSPIPFKHIDVRTVQMCLIRQPLLGEPSCLASLPERLTQSHGEIVNNGNALHIRLQSTLPPRANMRELGAGGEGSAVGVTLPPPGLRDLRFGQ